MPRGLADATPRPRPHWAPLLALFILGRTLAAQEIVPPATAADSAFNAGDLTRAESLYYVAVRARPRDPIAREELGRYIGMRGASRVAVVLLEEARLFGGDPSRIATRLAPLYESIGDWRALLTLPSSPLSAAERRRAAWLAEHPFTTRTDTAATTIVGPFLGDTLGRIAVHVGGRTAMAVLLAQNVGIVAGARLSTGDALVFSGDSGVAVLDSVAVGTARLVNVPAGIGGSPGAMAIGLSVFGVLTPTLDYAKNKVAFNRPLSILAPIRLPLISDRDLLYVLDRGRWIRLADYVSTVARARQTITIDFRAGEVRVQP